MQENQQQKKKKIQNDSVNNRFIAIRINVEIKGFNKNDQARNSKNQKINWLWLIKKIGNNHVISYFCETKFLSKAGLSQFELGILAKVKNFIIKAQRFTV